MKFDTKLPFFITVLYFFSCQKNARHGAEEMKNIHYIAEDRAD